MNWVLQNQYRAGKIPNSRSGRLFPLKDLAFLLGVSVCVIALIATGH